MAKHRSSMKSERLQRVLGVLRDAGGRGASTFEIQLLARVTDVKDTIYELRYHGFDISDVWEDRHKRYFLEPLA